MFSNITIKELKNYLEGFDENLPILFHSKYSGGFIFDKILLFKGIEPKHNHVNLEILDNKYYNIYYLNNKLVEDVKYLGLDVKINYFLTINEDVDLDWKWWIWMNNLSKILKNEYDITIKLSKIGDDKYKCYSYKMINNKFLKIIYMQ